MRGSTITTLLLLTLAGCGPTAGSTPTDDAAPGSTTGARLDSPPLGTSTLDMTTWSVVGVDPATGDVGVAMASCVPETLADAVAALVPGRGAAAIQAAWDLTNRNRVYDALREGLPAQEIIDRVADPAVDPGLTRRQYGIATIEGATVQVAGFTGEGILAGNNDPERPAWAGVMADASMGVTSQGNTLVGPQVVAGPLAAFQRHDVAGRNTLPDRLMRALEAGAIAGGDVRCNNERIVQTAATAMILVARGTDPAYATADIGMSDQGTPAAPWLAISVTDSLGGANPIVELRLRYDAWRSALGS